jgi:hypothetical protein
MPSITRKEQRGLTVAPGRIADDSVGLPTYSITGPIPLPTAEPHTSKPCSRCGRDLPLEAFNRDGRVRDGRRADCRECQRARARAIYGAAAARSPALNLEG